MLFSLIGTDGGRYTYLFKGLEDLHLDERIMQFLGKPDEYPTKRECPDCTGCPTKHDSRKTTSFVAFVHHPTYTFTIQKVFQVLAFQNCGLPFCAVYITEDIQNLDQISIN